MANVRDVIDEARKVSPGIAEWIDTQRARGRPDLDIHAALQAATTLARFERELPPTSAT